MEMTSSVVILLCVAAGAGALIAWLVMRARSAALFERLQSVTGEKEELEARADAMAAELRALESRFAARDAQLTAELKGAAEKLALVEDSREKLAESFRALSQEALLQNNHSFLEIAKTTFEKLQEGAKGELDQRKVAIDELVKPLKESLTKVDTKIEEIEKNRAASNAALAEQIKGLAGSEQALRDETKKLVHALRAPNVRGRWGEVQLRRVVEIAGMQEHCDFVEQESFATENGALRPDLIVNLSDQRRIVVDSKVPLMAYLEALEIQDEDQRVAKLSDHARLVRKHIGDLSSKQYWSQFDSAPECVVLFIAGDTLLATAIEKDPQLIEFAMQRNVVIATPMTLIALLRAVAVGWRQKQLAANAEQIRKLGSDLYERIVVALDNFSGVGKNLTRAVSAFNETVGSLEKRLLPAAKRFNELGLLSSKELPDLEIVEIATRELPERGGEPLRRINEETDVSELSK